MDHALSTELRYLIYTALLMLAAVGALYPG